MHLVMNVLPFEKSYRSLLAFWNGAQKSHHGELMLARFLFRVGRKRLPRKAAPGYRFCGENAAIAERLRRPGLHSAISVADNCA
jgi:hypothetical protein